MACAEKIDYKVKKYSYVERDGLFSELNNTSDGNINIMSTVFYKELLNLKVDYVLKCNYANRPKEQFGLVGIYDFEKALVTVERGPWYWSVCCSHPIDAAFIYNIGEIDSNTLYYQAVKAHDVGFKAENSVNILGDRHMTKLGRVFELSSKDDYKYVELLKTEVCIQESLGKYFNGNVWYVPPGECLPPFLKQKLKVYACKSYSVNLETLTEAGYEI